MCDNIFRKSLAGTAHIKMGVECEDVFKTVNNDDLIYMAVADGVSMRKHSGEGAKIVVNSLYQIMQYININSLIVAPQKLNALPNIIIQQITTQLEVIAASNQSQIHEYASTLEMILIDKRSGNFLCMHLGDGIIGGVRKSNELQLFTQRDRGLRKRQTYVTTTENAAQFIQLRYGDINHFRGLFLMTDGVSDQSIREDIREMMLKCDFDGAWSLAVGDSPQDDATMLAICF